MPSAGRPSARWIAATDAPLAPPPALVPAPAPGRAGAWASAPAAATVVMATARATPARPRSTSRRRRARCARRACDARADRRHARGELRSLSIPTEVFLRRLVAYGVSCRARAGRALRRALAGDSPRTAAAVSGSPAPRRACDGDSAGFRNSERGTLVTGRTECPAVGVPAVVLHVLGRGRDDAERDALRVGEHREAPHVLDVERLGEHLPAEVPRRRHGRVGGRGRGEH